MQHDRRTIVKGLGALAATMTAPAVASAQAPLPKAVPDFPDSQKFQTGDLLWPKKKGAFVPRTRSIGAAPPNEERKTWEAERQRALSEPQRAGLSPEVAEKLKTMRFDEFERLYHSGGAAPPAQGQATRGLLGDTISVGHVGIIEVGANGIAYVIEATPQGPGNASGVIRTRYADWLNAYANIQVWHGRLSATRRKRRAPASSRRRRRRSASPTTSSTSISTTTAASTAPSSCGNACGERQKSPPTTTPTRSAANGSRPGSRPRR